MLSSFLFSNFVVERTIENDGKPCRNHTSYTLHGALSALRLMTCFSKGLMKKSLRSALHQDHLCGCQKPLMWLLRRIADLAFFVLMHCSDAIVWRRVVCNFPWSLQIYISAPCLPSEQAGKYGLFPLHGAEMSYKLTATMHTKGDGNERHAKGVAWNARLTTTSGARSNSNGAFHCSIINLMGSLSLHLNRQLNS